MEDQTLRIMLLGKTGVGKSSLANTIYGEKDKFKESALANSETKECSSKATTVHGRAIRLVDTPGLFDTDLSNSDIIPKIVKSIKEIAPGPHAFLIVLRKERFTEHEEKVVETILEFLSEEAREYTTVVFTHGDDLPEGMDIKTWARQNKALKTLVQKCGGRCHVFDNKRWNNTQDPYRNNQYQIRELLNTIEETMRDKNWEYYTNRWIEYVLNNIQDIGFSMKYAAKTLLGALFGNEEFARDLSATQHADEETSQETNALRIILLGKCGSGKSSLANTIFGEQSFSVHRGLSGTRQCQSITRQCHGKTLQLMDTPGIFSGDQSSEIPAEVFKCISEFAPHAFLLVVRVEKFTRQEQAFVDLVLKYFSKEALNFTTVVFTHGDQLPEWLRVEDWAYENEDLKTLVQKCGSRCHVFDNRYWHNGMNPYRNNQYQVQQLLHTIDQMVRENGGRHYSYEMPQEKKPKSFFRWLFGF